MISINQDLYSRSSALLLQIHVLQSAPRFSMQLPRVTYQQLPLLPTMRQNYPAGVISSNSTI